MVTINNPMPSLPAFNQLAGIFNATPEQDEEDLLIQKAAEKQVEEERDEENAFIKLLQTLGKPQHAVAGVIHDMIDGGDFSPLDRIGKALSGEEFYRIKDVLDEIAPGKWSNVRMPNWMPLVGGEKVDLLKEGVGFMGDIYTDPLFHIGLGKITSKKLAPIKAEQQMLAKTIMKKGTKETALKGRPLHELRLSKKIAAKEAELPSSVLTAQSGIIATKEEAQYFRNILKKVQEKPEHFKRRYGAIPGIEGAIDDITGKTFASAKVSEQFRKGERAVLQMELGLGLQKLGIPNVNLLPQVVDKMAGSVVSMVEKSMAHLKGTKVGDAWISTFKDAFSHSTGNKMMDHTIFMVANAKNYRGKHYGQAVKEVSKTAGRHIRDDDWVRTVRDYIERPHDNFGGRWRDVPIKYGDDVAKQQALENTISQLQKIYHDLHAEEAATGLKLGFVGGRLFSEKEQYNVVRRRLLKDKVPLTPDKLHGTRSGGAIIPPTYSELKKIAKEPPSNIALSEKGLKTLKQRRINRAVEAEKEYAADLLHHELTDRLGGYMPHISGPGMEVFEKWMANKKFVYGSQHIGEVVAKFMKGRKWKDLSISEINDAFERGDLPHDLLNVLFENVEREIKAGDKGITKQLSRFLDENPENLHLFIEDPLQATTMRYTESLKAVSNKQFIDQVLWMSGRQVSRLEDLRLGEPAFLLSPQGMEAVYGPAWKTAIGDNAYTAYKTMVDERHLKAGLDLKQVFVDASDNNIMRTALAADVPMYSLPRSAVDEINKVMRIRTDPEKWRKMLKAYDYGTNMFKSMVLAPFPAYHARNVLGLMWNSFIGGTLSVGNMVDATKVLVSSKMLNPFKSFAGKKSSRLGEFTKPLERFSITTKNGDKIMGNQLIEWGHKFGVFTSFVEKEFVKKAGVTRPNLAKSVMKQFTHEGAVVAGGFEISHQMDQWGRMMHFIGELKHGKTPLEAAMSVKKYLFDYGDLTQFERGVLRRFALPFYSWSRQNIPLQLEALIRQPQKYGQLGRIAEAMQTEEARAFDQRKLPSWIQESFGIPARVNKRTDTLEVLVLRSWIPAADLMSVYHTNPLHAMSRTGMSLMHPLPRYVIEAYTNKNMFTGHVIKEVPGDKQQYLGMPMDKSFVHLMKSTPWGRLTSEVDKAVFQAGKEGALEAPEAIWPRTGVFPKIKGIKREASEAQYKFDIKQLARKYKRKLNAARRSGYQPLIDYWEDLHEDLARP